MALPEPVPGLVIAYSYLWKDQRRAGEMEGRKVRPCAVVVASQDEDGDVLVYVVPITHTRPTDDPHAIEVPWSVKRRLGLDEAPSWIVTSELNRFIWPGYDLRPIEHGRPDTFAWGFLPTRMFDAVKRAIALHRAARDLRIVPRD